MYTAVVEKELPERNRRHLTDIHFMCGVIKDHSGTFPCTPTAARATNSVACATRASMTPWERDITMLTSQYSSIHTRNVVIEGVGFITFARHDENGLLEHRSSVGATQCEPPVKTKLQEELLTEKMKRIYSCAMDVEVEDKSGHLDRLVENSTHFRAMNVREARSPSLSGRQLRMSRMSTAQIRGSIYLRNWPFQGVQTA
jgi:hypothetical protein